MCICVLHLAARIIASMQHDMRVISLFRCWDVIEDQFGLIAAFSSTVFLGQVFLIILLIILHRLIQIKTIKFVSMNLYAGTCLDCIINSSLFL